MPPGSSFEPLHGARHRVENIDGVDWVVIPARRNWFALPFLSIWLVAWSFAGATVVTQLFSGDPAERGFFAIWLTGWALGWIFAASMVFWQFAGRHMLTVQGGALVYRWRMPLLSRTKQYDAAQVRNLASSEATTLLGFGMSARHDAPPFLPSRGGTIKFDYGARTVRLVPALDESEGRMIVAGLAARLPRSATQPL